LVELLFRGNQEKGLVSFLVGGGGGADRFCVGGAGGGGDHGTEGREPEKPCNVKVTGDFGGNAGGF